MSIPKSDLANLIDAATLASARESQNSTTEEFGELGVETIAARDAVVGHLLNIIGLTKIQLHELGSII